MSLKSFRMKMIYWTHHDDQRRWRWRRSIKQTHPQLFLTSTYYMRLLRLLCVTVVARAGPLAQVLIIVQRWRCTETAAACTRGHLSGAGTMHVLTRRWRGQPPASNNVCCIIFLCLSVLKHLSRPNDQMERIQSSLKILFFYFLTTYTLEIV